MASSRMGAHRKLVQEKAQAFLSHFRRGDIMSAIELLFSDRLKNEKDIWNKNFPSLVLFACSIYKYVYTLLLRGTMPMKA